ncbi:GIY-YIG nuclease family protein [Rubeoparvulum massiliense]|uniref:GIY-YIG nuclease family protein n=1 Tax=Rubeoparvulum massiliense TaxID=1631346 RepID=UPI001E288948|nr:GIY-YIG nuclease family protein [Rubeoparvulum massiliense]
MVKMRTTLIPVELLPPIEAGHYVYMLLCHDGTLYTGYTVHLPHRLAMHRSGKGAKYTRGRLPVQLVYYEVGISRSWGLRREAEIKGWNKEVKWRYLQDFWQREGVLFATTTEL